MTRGLKWENTELYPYSCVFSCATVKQRNDTLGNDTWSEMGKTLSLYPYSCVFSCATVKQRKDTLGKDTWSKLGKIATKRATIPMLKNKQQPDSKTQL